MKPILESIAKTIDAHASELILFGFGGLLLAAYYKTHDQLIGTTMVTVIGAALGITTKRAIGKANVANVEQVNIESAEVKDEQ